MPNFKLVIEYVGTAYRGWQIQPGVPTIQGVLQQRLEVILREPVRALGAARTDAGVHAEGQVASVRIGAPVRPERLRHSLNALLPGDIGVRDVVPMDDAFHARHSARGRRYRYRIVHGEFLSPFLRPFAAHHRRPLDLEKMQEAARLLEGTRDFSSFRAAGDVSDTPIKEVRHSGITCSQNHEGLIHYTVEASSFLQHMVRNIAGTLIEVGRGRIEPDQIPSILAARDRRAAGPTAPAHGLVLLEVLYPRDVSG